MAKAFEELVYRDDFIFGKTMEDLILCHDVLECLLQNPLGKLEVVVPQREFRDMKYGKKIRVDVYAQSGSHIYDAEMQNLNHKTIESLYLPERSRFYASAVDIDFLAKGHSYRELPENNIVFICTFDPFNRNYWYYPFETFCTTDFSLPLKDRVRRYFFNTKYDGKDIPENVWRYYHYVETGEVTDELTARIDAAVDRIKSSEKWRSEYMKELLIFDDLRKEGRDEGMEEGLRKGKEEGREEGQFQLLTKLVLNGLLSAADAAASIGLSLEEFQNRIQN